MAQKGKYADPEWFTPSQYQDARQYCWQKLEMNKNLVLKVTAIILIKLVICGK